MEAIKTFLKKLKWGFTPVVHPESPKPKTANEEFWDRVKEKANAIEKMYKPGVRIVAKNEFGTWKDGVVIRWADWCLFTTYILVRFDDGEICKVADSNIGLA
jgi:hypothetical protein